MYQAKINLLNQMYKQYKLPRSLYSRLKLAISTGVNNKKDVLNQFLNEIPHDLRIEVSLIAYKPIYSRVKFLKDKSNSLISWICPLLKPFNVIEQQHIYFEFDEILNIYFLKKGECAYVHPNYSNCTFIRVKQGLEFGIVDIIVSCMKDT